MRVYILTAYDVEKKFCLDEQVFSSLAKAYASKDALLDYLAYNHDLDRSKVEEWSEYLTILDAKYSVSVRPYDVSTKVTSYT